MAYNPAIQSKFPRNVTFYRFPGETHELSRSGSPLHRVQRAVIILDFFTKHLAEH